MSDELGALTYGKKEEQIFLGREIGHNRDFSEETARQIDIAVKKIIDDAMDTVTKLLTEHRDILALMAEELLEHETIVLSDIERMVEELRPGKYTSRMRKPAKKKMKGTPRPEESDEDQVEAQGSETVADKPVEDVKTTAEDTANDTSEEEPSREPEKP
jgi:cell division protease FtsH